MGNFESDQSENLHITHICHKQSPDKMVIDLDGASSPVERVVGTVGRSPQWVEDLLSSSFILTSSWVLLNQIWKHGYALCNYTEGGCPPLSSEWEDLCTDLGVKTNFLGCFESNESADHSFESKTRISEKQGPPNTRYLSSALLSSLSFKSALL